MNSSTPLVTSVGFKPVSKEVQPSKLTKALPKIRNATMALLAALGIRSAVETYTSNPQTDARAVAGWSEDVLVDLENTEVTTVDFEALSAEEKMELRDLCSKVPSIPESYYKNESGENIPVTTQHLHEIVNVLIDEFQQEKKSDMKRMIGWFIALLASWGFGKLLVGQYRNKDKRNKDAYFYSLFDEVKEYRKDGLEKNCTTTTSSIETLMDEQIAHLRLTYNIIPSETYDPLDQPLQAFIANKIIELSQEKTTLLGRCSSLLTSKKAEVDAGRSPAIVQAINLDTEFTAILQKAHSAIVLMNSSISEQERDLQRQQEIIQDRLQKELDKKKAMEKAEEDALLLSEGGLITPDNKEVIARFLDEMKDGKVTQQDITDLTSIHEEEMKQLTDRQTEVTELLAFDDLPVLPKLDDIKDDFAAVKGAYDTVADLYARTVVLGYTEMNMDAVNTQIQLVDGLQNKITDITKKLEGELDEEEFEISFDDDSLTGLENAVTQKEQLESDLRDAKKSYLQAKEEVGKQLGILKNSLDVFLGALKGDLEIQINDLSEIQNEQLQRLNTLYEMRDKWATEKQNVLDGLMTHIEGGAAEEHRKTEQKITDLEDSIGKYVIEKDDLEQKIARLENEEATHTVNTLPIVKTLGLNEDDVNMIHIQGLIEDILQTSLTWGSPPDGMATIENIVVQNDDGGYKNIPSAGTYIKLNVGNKEFTGLLVKLNSLGKLMKIVQERDAVTTNLEKNKQQLQNVVQKLETAHTALGVSKQLLEKLTEQLVTSAQQKEALEIIKAALARVIDSIVSPLTPVTYDSLEEVEQAFNDAIVVVIFEKNSLSSL